MKEAAQLLAQKERQKEPAATASRTGQTTGKWEILDGDCLQVAQKQEAGIARLIFADLPVRQGPLKAPKAKYLLYGKAAPFGEPMGGIDGEYTPDDFYEYYHGPKVRGHWGRCYGRHPQRVRSTRQARVTALLEEARPFLPGGLWTHQLSSHQAPSGQRTFRHDVAVFGLTDREDFGELNSDSYVRWLPLPAAHPQALRAVLAGSSLTYPGQAFGLPEESVQTWNGSPFGIEGALGWQPTFLLDDRVWGAYVSATRNQRLYHAFGDWKGHLGDGARAKRESTSDSQFARAQAARHAQAKQQCGNRQRQRQARERLQQLLEAARPLWDQVQAEPHHGRGRPPHRARLEELLKR